MLLVMTSSTRLPSNSAGDQGVFALFGAVDGAPLLHARAGDGLAVAILGV